MIGAAAIGGPGGDCAIRLENVTRRFGRFQAVRDVDLSVETGSVYGLIGPNGAGKTTTLRMVAGLLAPSEGAVFLQGVRLERRSMGRLHRNVGYMPDFFGVYEDMRAWEYLDFFARCQGVHRARRAQLVEELLDLVNLSDKRESDVDSLSRGMQQRLCLAQALVHDPAILLLDEPASGLDPRHRLEMRELLKELKALGKTIVISSHILADLEEICDAVGIMDGGELRASGAVAEIGARRRGASEIRLAVLGDSATAREILSQMPQVELLETDALPIALAPDAPAVATLSFLLDGGLEAQADVLAGLATQGVRVVSFAPEGTRLEEVFMRMTAQRLDGLEDVQ